MKQGCRQNIFTERELNRLIKRLALANRIIAKLRRQRRVDWREGKRREMFFLRSEKIEELLGAQDSIGSFLCAFRDSNPNGSDGASKKHVAANLPPVDLSNIRCPDCGQVGQLYFRTEVRVDASCPCGGGFTSTEDQELFDAVRSVENLQKTR
jgi:hypothetical protein